MRFPQEWEVSNSCKFNNVCENDLAQTGPSNVADYADRLPKSVVEKGGVFIVNGLPFVESILIAFQLQSMYQREALWLSFLRDSTDCAVKISVGGVNALTGLPQDQIAPPKIQDYVPVNETNGQM